MERSKIVSGLVVWAFLVLSSAPLSAQLAEPLPRQMEGIGVDQKLEGRVSPDLRFVDEKGESVRLGEFFDGERPVLLSLVYYECPMLCTLVLDGMTQVLREMEWTPGDQFEVVTVSIDHGETPELAAEKKRAYLRSYGRPEADNGWHFLVGDEEPIRQLADEVGFRFNYVEETGEYAHPAVLFVLTSDGQISRYLFGVQHQSQTLRLSLVEASEGRIGSPVDKFLLYCYQYDAQEGRYAPVAMKLMRVGGLLTILVFGAVLLSFWLRDLRNRRKRLA